MGARPSWLAYSLHAAALHRLRFTASGFTTHGVALRSPAHDSTISADAAGHVGCAGLRSGDGNRAQRGSRRAEENVGARAVARRPRMGVEADSAEPGARPRRRPRDRADGKGA